MSGVAYVAAFAVVALAPVLWIALFGKVSDVARRSLVALVVALGLAAALTPAVIQTLNARTFDNVGFFGLFVGLLTLVIPAVLIAAAVSALAWLLAVLRFKRKQAVTEVAASGARRVAWFAGILTFVPVFAMGLWLGVALYQVG